MTLLKLITTYQSVVTILDAKLRQLAACPEIRLHVASSFEDPAETRRCAGDFHEVYIPRSIQLIGDIRAIVKLYRLIRKYRFDIVHTHTAKAGTVGAIAGALAGVPVMHTYHGLPFFEGQHRAAFVLYRGIEVFLSRFRRAVFSQNRRDYELLKALKGLRCPVYFEGNGVNAEEIGAGAKAHAADVKALFADERMTHVLCIARLEPVKHLEKVLDVMAFLRERKVAADCIIAGKGPLKSDLEREIEARGLAGCVSIVYSPYIHAIIARADMVILTSAKEGIPRGLMEAMALSRPVVATDVLGTNELVVHDETGFLVRFDEQRELNAAIMKLVADKELRRRFGAAGRERIEREFDDRRAVELWVGKYREIINQKS
jgi:glycosyltransferase involved in cell wall biosynthesis